MKGILLRVALLGAIASSQPAWAGSVLIVNGASGTSEPDTTASITDRLSGLHVAVGNTVTVADDLPADLSGYSQVWDLRFSNLYALSSSVISSYVSYLAGGGGMFVMGENDGFDARNQSILQLIQAAGGGTLTFETPGDSQTVQSPFTGPNAVSDIQYSAAGGVDGTGTGQWISVNGDGSAGSGVAFGLGTLANAKAGALTTIFDVNFLQTTANDASLALSSNLVGFVQGQVDPTPAVPEPASWAMMIAGIGMVGGAMRWRAAPARVRVRIG